LLAVIGTIPLRDLTVQEVRTALKGVPVDEITRLAGHASSRTTVVIYR
jgi:hypothetical protein